MARKYPCIESTLDFELGNYIVRLWINKEAVPEDYLEEENMLKKIREFYEKHVPTAREMFTFIEAFENINAVQIQFKAGDMKFGTVLYLVDFSSDVHG